MCSLAGNNGFIEWLLSSWMYALIAILSVQYENKECSLKLTSSDEE